MQKTCTQCSAEFEIADTEVAHIKKFDVDVPLPTICPFCREQVRMSHRNEWNLYHRKCDATGKQIISMYSTDKPYKVYDQQVWWSDAYNPLDYGREIDFSRPFFEQFFELEREVPKLAIINAKSENCLYTNYSGENKDCYLVVGGLESQDCYYSYRIFYSKDICDCYDLYQCERCYECLESTKLYECLYSTQCHNCSSCILCKDCIGCKDCFGCVNLTNKQYYIYNRKFSKEDYERKVAELRKNLDVVRPDIEHLHATEPHRFAHIVNCESATGDQLWECKDVETCFTLKKSRDCGYSKIGEGNKDCFDCNFFDNCELQYMSANNEKNYNVLFSSLIWYCKDVLYSMNCFSSNTIFGCTGLKKQNFCILNKQYSEDEYKALVPKLVDHMKTTGEWGTFFPPKYSAFGYNETVAYEFAPLEKEEVVQRGWVWKEEQQDSKQYLGPNVTEDTEDICKKILTCNESGKHYRIIPQELRFYESMQLPVPDLCPTIRHRKRMERLNPRTLWSRNCGNCGVNIRTTYSPERPEKIFCEPCYQNSLI